MVVITLALLLFLRLGGRRSFLLLSFFLLALGGALVVFVFALAYQFLEKCFHGLCFFF